MMSCNLRALNRGSVTLASIALFFSLLLTGSGCGSNLEGTGARTKVLVSGTVVDEQANPVKDVAVSDASASAQAVTDAQGRFTIEVSATGDELHLFFSGSGIEESPVTVPVDQGATQVNPLFVLTRNRVVLAVVDTDQNGADSTAANGSDPVTQSESDEDIPATQGSGRTKTPKATPTPEPVPPQIEDGLGTEDNGSSESVNNSESGGTQEAPSTSGNINSTGGGPTDGGGGGSTSAASGSNSGSGGRGGNPPNAP